MAESYDAVWLLYLPRFFLSTWKLRSVRFRMQVTANLQNIPNPVFAMGVTRSWVAKAVNWYMYKCSAYALEVTEQSSLWI